MLVKELKPGALDGRRWDYQDSPVMAVAGRRLCVRRRVPRKERKHTPDQEAFYIMSHAFLE